MWLRAVKKGRGAKLIGDAFSRQLNSQGYDIYSVINDGGENDSRGAQHYSWNLMTGRKTFN